MWHIGSPLAPQGILLKEIKVILLESRVIFHTNCYKKNNFFTLHTFFDILSHRWWLPLTYTYAFLRMLSAKSSSELRNFGDKTFSLPNCVLKKVFFQVTQTLVHPYEILPVQIWNKVVCIISNRVITKTRFGTWVSSYSWGN